MLNRLRELYPVKTVSEIHHLFGRFEGAVSSKAKLLGIEKAVTRKKWSRKELAQLRKLYADTPMPELEARFGCAKGVIYQRAGKLNLHRSKAFTVELARKHAERPDHPMKAHRFPKGHVPANKGLRRPGFAPGRMKETQFKKGNRTGAANLNWVPIGTEVVDSYGYRRRKTRDGMVPTIYNWEFCHKLLWAKHRGRIPKGHVIVFKDGDKTNIRMKNLECISMADNMRRNTLHRLPPELKEVIYLRGAIRHRITTRRRKLEKQDRGSQEPPVRDAGGAQGQGESHADRAGRGHRRHRPGDRQQRQGRGRRAQAD